MWLRTWRPLLIIFVLGWLLYGQTLFFDFTYFDDQSLILENYNIVSRPENIGEIFLNDVFFDSAKFYYRPLLNLSLMLDMNIGGALPVVFHFSNVLIHILAALLVFFLFKRLKYQEPLAFFLSLFFLFHPVLTQAVAWIPGRNDSLLALLTLAAFLSFLSFKDRPRLSAYLAYLFFFLLALFTKESAVFLPFLVIFYFLAVERKVVAIRDRWLLVAGSAALMLIWFLLRLLALNGPGLTLELALSSLSQNLPALLVSLGKTLLPFNLSVLPILADAKIIYGLIVTPLLLVALFFSRQKRSALIIFGFSWFLLFLLPSFIRPSTIDTPDFLEHRLYLPLIGFLIILAELDFVKNLDFKKKSLRFVLLIILLFLAACSWRQIQNFRDRLTFWEAAAAGSPHSSLAQRNLGVMYYLSDDWERAEKYYRRSLALKENERMAHNNLGVIYLNQGSYGRAEKEFYQELAVNPNYDKALFNLGDLYYRKKDFSRANDFFQAALQVNPRYYEAYEHWLILQNQLR